MINESFLTVVWRRRWIVLGTVLAFSLITGLYSATLPKEYESSATLLIAAPSNGQTFDAVQAAQVAARTYGNIVASPNIAESVSERLGGSPSRDDLISSIVAEPVAETQLLKITATAGTAVDARRIANTYADVFTSYVRTRLTPTTKVTLSVADEAAVPDSPARPKPKLYVLIGTLLGIALGLALAALRDRFDNRLRSVDDLESATGLPILARVPTRGKSEASLVAFTDAFRTLRTNLQFAYEGDRARTIAITSGGPGDGKSTTTSNLALASAAAGGRIVVVEADMRRPAQQAFFRPDVTRPLLPGLTSFIVGGAPLEECLHTTRIASTIDLLPAGPPVPSLSGLLESARGGEVLEAVARASDLALFDCPPLSAGADAATVCGQVDGVVLVVSLESITRARLRETLRQLEAVRAHVLGIVVNRDGGVEAGSYGYEMPVASPPPSGVGARL